MNTVLADVAASFECPVILSFNSGVSPSRNAVSRPASEVASLSRICFGSESALLPGNRGDFMYRCVNSLLAVVPFFRTSFNGLVFFVDTLYPSLCSVLISLLLLRIYTSIFFFHKPMSYSLTSKRFIFISRYNM